MLKDISDVSDRSDKPYQGEDSLDQYISRLTDYAHKYPYLDEIYDVNEEINIENVLNGWTHTKKIPLIIKLLKERYKKENSAAEAAFTLYFIYYFGLSGKQDIKNAKIYLEKAVEKNHAAALIEKARLCRYGLAGYPVNFSLMLKCYQQAENYDGGAKLKLAECYEKGLGVAVNRGKAKEYYLHVFQKGLDVKCQTKAAIALYKKYSEKISDFKIWLDFAVLHEDSDSLFLKAGCLESGTHGYEKNSTQALEHYKQAAELGNKDAIYYLAQCFIDGNQDLGIEKNIEQAGILLHNNGYELERESNGMNFSPYSSNEVGSQVDLLGFESESETVAHRSSTRSGYQSSLTEYSGIFFARQQTQADQQVQAERRPLLSQQDEEEQSQEAEKICCSIM